MAITPRTQLLKNFGAKEETTWGTPVTVDTFWPIVDFTPGKSGPEVTFSNAIISGKLTDEAAFTGSGNESYDFQVGGELYDHAMTHLFKWWLGAVATTGAGPYTHTITQGEPLPAYTAQIAAPDTVAGTVRALTYAGCVTSTWEATFDAGKRALWGMKVNAKSATTATAVATLAYPTSITPVHAQNVVPTLFSGAANVKHLKISGDNKQTYDERRFLGSTQIGARQLGKDTRDYMVEMTLEFEDWTNYARYTAQTRGGIVATVTVGSNTTTITLPTGTYTEGVPKFTGKGLVEQSIKAQALGSGATDPITIVCVNGDSLP